VGFGTQVISNTWLGNWSGFPEGLPEDGDGHRLSVPNDQMLDWIRCLKSAAGPLGSKLADLMIYWLTGRLLLMRACYLLFYYLLSLPYLKPAS